MILGPVADKNTELIVSFQFVRHHNEQKDKVLYKK